MPMKISIFVIIVLHLTSGGVAATSTCSDAIAKAGPGANPKVDNLPSAVMDLDIESVCLLLQAGKDVNEKAK